MSDLHLQSFISLQLHPTSRRWSSIMVKPGVLILLLAVAASQVDLLSAETVTGAGGLVDINGCPIVFYGQRYTYLDVTFSLFATVAFCFKNDPIETTQDCLWVQNRGSADSVEVLQNQITTSPGSAVHGALPNFLTTSLCFLYIRLHNSIADEMLDIYLYDFAPQTAMEIVTYSDYTPFTVILASLIDGGVKDLWSFPSSSLRTGTILDISGCRYSDAALKAGEQTLESENCTIVCNQYAVLDEVSLCEPWDDCHDKCPVTCTVTASSVISIYNQFYHIPDRCTYTLMEGYEGSVHFEVAAGFRERRRKDWSFLDYLIISVSHPSMSYSPIYLEQGGRAEADGQTLTLTTTPQLFHGVELSKDQHGFIAKIPDVNMTVFFDGNTAHVTGIFRAVEGLCGNTTHPSEITTPTAQKSSTYSSFGCETQHRDAPDLTISCSDSAARCNLMGQAPFQACHDHIDPGPYITACANTLCNYPAVDGLLCHFLEAYSMSCDLMNATLEDWRSTAGCSVVLQDSCWDQYCSDHEFCGENLGETRCLCRALFTSQFNTTHPFGMSTVCMESSATLTLAACLLWEQNIDYSVLHLNDESCTGDMDYQTHMVDFSFNSSAPCGAEITTSSSQVLYNNTVMTSNNSMEGIIHRHDDVEINFSCLYIQPDVSSLSFTVRDSSVVHFIVSDVWNYTVTMTTYLDPGHQEFLEPGLELELNQRIWLVLNTQGLDNKFVVMVMDSCWATEEPSPDVGPRYDLIIDGCPNPADETIQVEENGLGMSSSFSFRLFEFFDGSTEIHLHCHVELCPKDPSCVPICGAGGRRRRRSIRSEDADGNPNLVTMAWTT